MPALFKGQQFSTAGEGRVGGQKGSLLPNTHHPGEGGGPIRDTGTPPPPPCGPALEVLEGPLFLWKRGAASLPWRSRPAEPCWPAATASPMLDEPLCQHSVNTQYCIKAINSHFKETETQFSHQSQEQRLAGLRNVTAQLAAPPPWPQPQLEGGG